MNIGTTIARVLESRSSPLIRRIALRAVQALIGALVITALLCLFPKTAHAQRIEYLANTEVHGIGTVTGLSRTREGQHDEILEQQQLTGQSTRKAAR